MISLLIQIMLFSNLHRYQQLLFQQNYMERKQILELIESIVKPLRQKIQHLQRQNESLKTQINTNIRPPQDSLRKRSNSRQYRRTPNKAELKETQSPLSKKKEEKHHKPEWNYHKPTKPESNSMKSPPPKDRNIQTPNSKGVRPSSRDRAEPEKKEIEKDVEKRIVGGMKVDLSEDTIQINKVQSPPLQTQQ